MTKINFELIQGIILINATVDGKNGFFAFDTGANATVLNIKYFDINIHEESSKVVNFDEEVKSSNGVYTKVINNLSFGNIMKTNMTVACFDLAYVEEGLKTFKEDLVLLGIIGINIIRDYTVLLDYQKKLICLDPVESFVDYQEADFELINNSFTVIGVLIKNKCYKMVLDTGANGCLINEEDINVNEFMIVDQEMKAINIPMLYVGNKKFSKITALIRNLDKLRELIDIQGVIGYSILSEQRTIIDYKTHKIYFENNIKGYAI